MDHFTSRLVALTIGLSLFPCATADATDWPNWRGPHFNGSTEIGHYPAQLTHDTLAWKIELPGKGSSSPIIWDGQIYLTSPAEGQDAVLAFNLEGRLLWKTLVGPASAPKHRTLGSSSNASPVADADGVYAYFRSGHLAAIRHDGTLRWSTNLTDQFGPEQLFWDQGSSPVLTSQDVILTRLHGGESWVAGFDRSTGSLRWQQPRNYPTPSENNNAYATPLLFQRHGQSVLLVWGADHLTAHNPTNGSVLWSAGGFNPDATPNWPAIASPLVIDNLAIVPAGRDDRPGQSHLYGIRLGGSGDVTTSHRAWSRDNLGVFVCSPAEYRNRIYLLRHRGEIACLDPKTGDTLWNDTLPRDRSSYYSSPLIAGGILYAAREDGVVFCARVEDTFQLLSENPLGERVVASPVPASAHRVLIRGDEHLFCFQQAP